MKIRELKDSEAYFLEDMLYAAIFVPEGHEAPPRSIIKEKSLSRYVSNWGKVKYDVAFVAEVDNELVGAVWGRLLTEENKGFGFVDNETPELGMAVKAGFRNQGIGTKLITTIIAQYQKIGVNHLSLSVDSANNAANLYQRLGFRIVQATETSWTMKKEIK